MIFDGSLERNLLFRRGCDAIHLLSNIETIDICLMMLGVVESHDLLADIGLESIVGVWQGREGVRLFGTTICYQRHGERRKTYHVEQLGDVAGKG